MRLWNIHSVPDTSIPVHLRKVLCLVMQENERMRFSKCRYFFIAFTSFSISALHDENCYALTNLRVNRPRHRPARWVFQTLQIYCILHQRTFSESNCLFHIEELKIGFLTRPVIQVLLLDPHTTICANDEFLVIN